MVINGAIMVIVAVTVFKKDVAVFQKHPVSGTLSVGRIQIEINFSISFVAYKSKQFAQIIFCLFTADENAVDFEVGEAVFFIKIRRILYENNN